MKVKHFDVPIEVKEEKKNWVEEEEEEVCGKEEDSDRRCICYKNTDKALKSGMLQTVSARLWVQVVWR